MNLTAFRAPVAMSDPGIWALQFAALPDDAGGLAKILQAAARPVHGERLAAALARLTDGVARYDLELIGNALRDAVPEFAPMEASPVRETGATIVAFPPRHARLS